MFHGAAFDGEAADFGFAVDDSFVGEDGAEAGAPVDGDFGFIGEAVVGEDCALISWREVGPIFDF